jgi:hypothetical protein
MDSQKTKKSTPAPSAILRHFGENIFQINSAIISQDFSSFGLKEPEI